MIRRDWTDAVAAHEGHGCRVCTAFPRELAHIIPRTYDRCRGDRGTVRVNPLAVVPLCTYHHGEYDARNLDLSGHLTESEVAHAVGRIGQGSALRYISGPHSRAGLHYATNRTT